jgi:hypothetical protein
MAKYPPNFDDDGSRLSDLIPDEYWAHTSVVYLLDPKASSEHWSHFAEIVMQRWEGQSLEAFIDDLR